VINNARKQEVIEANFAEKHAKNRPLATHKAGNGVEVNLWNNQGPNGDYLSASIRHSYKDKDGQWQQQSISIPVDALAGLSLAAADAHRSALQERSFKNAWLKETSQAS
jgi:hypothetical protein